MNNNSVKTKISGYGYDGEGVCRVEGKVTFVPFVIEGEEVEISLDRETSSFFKGKLLKVISASTLRQTPPCPYFSKCGGCVYQHTTYLNELEIKQKLLASQLAKCGYTGEIHLTPSEQRFGYRNKIKLFADKSVGLKKRNSNEIIDIEQCPLVSEKINIAISIVKKFLLQQKLTNLIKEIVLREDCGQVLVNFYKKTNKSIDYSPLFNSFGENIGLFETFKGKTAHIGGLKQIENEEFGLKCSFKPTSFHQVNKFVMPKLYKRAIELVKGDRILNCYSGAGVLSGILAKKFKNVVGIELGDSEHEDAQKFKKANNLDNLLNLHGDCGKLLKSIDKFDTILIDPPKAGADKNVCLSLNESGSERIIYISCDSATMVRDVSRMPNYKITYAHLFDMFACTGEYESLIVLEKS